jgi:hypothetical protein
MLWSPSSHSLSAPDVSPSFRREDNQVSASFPCGLQGLSVSHEPAWVVPDAVASAQMLRNRWGVPILHTVGELAEFLEVSLNDLQWFADRRGMQIRETKQQLHHYTYRWIPKRDESSRLVEQPKLRLKLIQRSILQHIVGLIPLHGAAHGFVPGRSVITAALPHVHQRSYSGDFRAHLLGRIGWVSNTNTQRGTRLMALFNQIAWGELD